MTVRQPKKRQLARTYHEESNEWMGMWGPRPQEGNSQSKGRGGHLPKLLSLLSTKMISITTWLHLSKTIHLHSYHTKAKNTLQTDLHLTDVFTIFLKGLKSAVANCCFPPQAVRVGTPSMCSWLHRFCNTLNSWSITSAVPGFFISFIGVYRIGANRRRIFHLCVWLQPYSTLQRLLVDIICITTGAPVLKLRFSKLYSTVYCGS